MQLAMALPRLHAMSPALNTVDRRMHRLVPHNHIIGYS